MEEHGAADGLFVRLKPRTGAVIQFTLDGCVLEGFAGDTLLTAILLNRITLRRFEFGKGDRAGYCLMGACQDCWVGLSDGRSVAACATLLVDGMVISTGGKKA